MKYLIHDVILSASNGDELYDGSGLSEGDVVAIIKLLKIKGNFRINEQRSNDFYTPLHLAASKHLLSVVKLLIIYGMLKKKYGSLSNLAQNHIYIIYIYLFLTCTCIYIYMCV